MEICDVWMYFVLVFGSCMRFVNFRLNGLLMVIDGWGMMVLGSLFLFFISFLRVDCFSLMIVIFDLGFCKCMIVKIVLIVRECGIWCYSKGIRKLKFFSFFVFCFRILGRMWIFIWFWLVVIRLVWFFCRSKSRRW